MCLRFLLVEAVSLTCSRVNGDQSFCTNALEISAS